MDDISLKQSETVMKTVKIVQEASSGQKLHTAENRGKDATRGIARPIPEKRRSAQLKKLVNQANLKAGVYNVKIKFQINTDGQQPTILVVDKESGKIIRKIPAHEMSDLSSKMEKYVGTIFNGRV